MHQLNSVDAINDNPASSVDTNKFIEEITVNTTEMFRDPSFWSALREHILPQLNLDNYVCIWHAGCSTGEVMMNPQILLDELNMRHKVQTFASDINLDVLGIAQKASYSMKNLLVSEKNHVAAAGNKNLEHDLESKTDFQMTFRKDVLRNVTFKRFALVQDVCTKKFD